nr:phospholipase-like protein [Tanacetum cinerariifolium]
MVVATQILGRLTKNQLALFRTTCFGSWLDVQHTGGDPQLTHLILQTQVFHDPPPPDEMWFDIGGHKIRFSREEFCLITGLRFGSDSHILPWVAGMSNNPFKDRMFPNIPSGQLVKLPDIVKIFDDMHPSVPMDDHDAVRICLLMLLHMGFLGRQPINIVRDELLMLVEDLDSWNLFPWGSYVWQFTYPQLSKAITQRHDSHAAPRPQGKLIKYTLTGFIWAFKIWILEAFPFALSNFQQDVGLIPRAISWRRIHPFSWEKCLNFVVVDERRPALRTLTPTDAERQTEWWKITYPQLLTVSMPAGCRLWIPPLLRIKRIVILQARRPLLTVSTTQQYQGSDTAPTYQQLLQQVATLEDTVKQLVQRVTTLEGPSHVGRDTVLEGAIPSTANLLPRTIPIKSRVMPLRAAEFRAYSLEDQQHHHVDKDGRVGSTSPREDTSSRQTMVPTPLDKRVATLDERVAALESCQCAIPDMVTRLPVFSKTVQLLSDRVEEVEPGNRPSQVEIIENVHKRQKGKGEWRDSMTEKVAFNICKNIKEKIVSEYETADDSAQPSDDPFDPRTWAEVICVPEKKKVNGAGCSQEAENKLNQSNSMSSTKEPHCNNSAPDDNKTKTELEITARIEAEVKSRVEVVRLEMKEQMEKQFKQMFETLRNTMPYMLTKH